MSRLSEMLKVAVVGAMSPLNAVGGSFTTPYSAMYMQNQRLQQLLLERAAQLQQLLLERAAQQRQSMIQRSAGGPNSILAQSSPLQQPQKQPEQAGKLDALRDTLRPFTASSVGVPGPRSLG